MDKRERVTDTVIAVTDITVMTSTVMDGTNGDLMDQLVALAAKGFGGHFIVMKFTTNWRVSFGTPNDRFAIEDMPVGKTFEEAARKALKNPRWPHGREHEKAFFGSL
jgi:hypothetical protein